MPSFIVRMLTKTVSTSANVLNRLQDLADFIQAARP